MLRAQWLRDAVTVPHVPTLGPVHPDAGTADLFTAVHRIEPGQFLPFDKDRRWATHKDETVLVGHTRHTPRRTTVATLARRQSRLTVYHYASTRPDLPAAQEQAAALARRYGATAARVVWFQHSPPPSAIGCVRALVAPTGIAGAVPDRPILALGDCSPPVRDSFAEFCRHIGEGMAHLGRRWAARQITVPIFVAIDGNEVVGAIGPMQTLPGPTETWQLLPQYFAVLPTHRQSGHGRALWRAAQHWGRRAGAAYQLLQTTPDSPAEALYRSEGARPIGLVCTVPA